MNQLLIALQKLRDEHLEHREKYYEKSVFVASAPKVPRIGGVILAQGISREELEGIIKEDPFWKKQIAEYEIVEFNPTKLVPFSL